MSFKSRDEQLFAINIFWVIRDEQLFAVVLVIRDEQIIRDDYLSFAINFKTREELLFAMNFFQGIRDEHVIRDELLFAMNAINIFFIRDEHFL